MKIVVTIKQVPDTYPGEDRGGREVDRHHGHHVDRLALDEFAVEEALRIKEKRGQGEVVAVSSARIA
jgi:electron transfer flavoprotein alpha/beta subunit